ncbi:hypothetical protein [Timonella sp. A28]|uniref:hypothetical protein n=1 Tax=Timonella sp. A28 TaxID=3442640 RepID=UPI003EB74D89
MNQLRFSSAPLPAAPGTHPKGQAEQVTHFLAVNDYLDPADIEFLVQCRYPKAVWETLPSEAEHDGGIEVAPGVLRLSARSIMHGPYLPSVLADENANGSAQLETVPHPANFPHATAMVWALTTVRERGEEPFPHSGDRDGLARIFAEGLPIREEYRQVTTLVAMARYLNGSAHFDAVFSPPTRVYQPRTDVQRYRQISPDAAANVDRIIYSDVWLDPQAALRIGQLVAPTMGYMPTEIPWEGPADPEDNLDRTYSILSQEEIDALHERAEQADREILSAPQQVSAYGLVYEVTQGDIISIEVGGTDELPPVLDNIEWARNGVVEYRIRWVPDDLDDWQKEIPSFDLRKRRTRILEIVSALTKGFYAATSGEIVDEDGFLHDPRSL